MVVVAQGDEAERLQTGGLKFACGVEHFGHSADGAGASVESDFDEISGGQLMVKLEQSAVEGNGLEFSALAQAAFGHDGSCNRSIKLYTGSTLAGVFLGEMGHSQENYATSWVAG